jgi:hypothetical protein
MTPESKGVETPEMLVAMDELLGLEWRGLGTVKP